MEPWLIVLISVAATLVVVFIVLAILGLIAGFEMMNIIG